MTKLIKTQEVVEVFYLEEEGKVTVTFDEKRPLPQRYKAYTSSITSYGAFEMVAIKKLRAEANKKISAIELNIASLKRSLKDNTNSIRLLKQATSEIKRYLE